MHKIGMAIRELHRSENQLAGDLLRMSDRHRTDHEVYHLARDLARWSQQHVTDLARVGRDYGLRMDEQVRDESGLLGSVEQRTAELLGRRRQPGLLLIADLRHLYRNASGVSLDWEVLAQGAQAIRDRQLLGLAQRCHPQTLRQARWANAKLKETSAQVLVS
ncbi:hypothetical protein GCM10027280_18320 [Micromonospora polyrhachis]|uniref:Uncharacterized protein n=1 Tax=Micromonospora polyrhachis TaxID=1282883 RepID=A0A7W7WMX4_9ACTN|nr:hypothetical protein [Micromonospora polyrhachis]MBB4956929.1 hypothetical protein [Micromonospora polyrhachis]